ncbi:MAG: DUF1905 domain-containing protein [Candidatus Nanopelagicales bacterium]
MSIEATFSAPLWRWSGESAWHFLTVPEAVSDDIASRVEPGPGFGSVKVTASVGGTTWSTSVFPDSRSGRYLLPVKAAVRRRERIEDGDEIDVRLVVEV